MEEAEDLDENMSALLEKFEDETGEEVLHTVAFY